VLLLSEALNNELAQDGVNVSVLCPGPTHTEFGVRADMSSAKILNVPWVMSAAEVAEIGFSGLMKGKKIIIPGLMNKLLAFSVRFTPRSIMVLIIRSLNQK
jgi:short-subunit dehydrogenase